jgi:cbb3-type cytochrome c oxidase subunit III
MWRDFVSCVAIAFLLVGSSSVPRIRGVRPPRLPAVESPAEIAVGRAVFVKKCAQCHQADGGGSIAPNLTDRYWIHGGSSREIYQTVHDGVAAKNMPAWGRVLSADRLSATVAFVRSLQGTTPAKPKGPQGVDADSSAAGSSGWAVRIQ